VRIRLVGLEREKDELAVPLDLKDDRMPRLENSERRPQAVDRRDRLAVEIVDGIAGLQVAAASHELIKTS
jgi:hypothetical protein